MIAKRHRIQRAKTEVFGELARARPGISMITDPIDPFVHDAVGSRPTRCQVAIAAALALSTASAAGCAADAEPARVLAPVVYGGDGRQDFFEAADPAFAELLRSATVALVDPRYIDLSDPDNVVPDTMTLGEYQDLCAGERFADQPAMASCSGTLIDDDLVLTAAHCVNATVCDEWYFVFGFFMSEERQLNRMTAADVYTCEEIVVATYTEDASEDTWHDYAIVRLDRPVAAPREPVPVAMDAGALRVGDGLTALGFGNGIPGKVHAGGFVRRSTVSWGYFTGSTDTFAGNSGSGTYNDRHELVGVFVRGGDDDYVKRRGDGCSVVNTVSEGEASQEYDYAGKAVDELCARGYPSVRLCGGEDPTPDPTPDPDPEPDVSDDPEPIDATPPEPGDASSGCLVTTAPSTGLALMFLAGLASWRRRRRRPRRRPDGAAATGIRDSRRVADRWFDLVRLMD